MYLEGREAGQTDEKGVKCIMCSLFEYEGLNGSCLGSFSGTPRGQFTGRNTVRLRTNDELRVHRHVGTP